MFGSISSKIFNALAFGLLLAGIMAGCKGDEGNFVGVCDSTSPQVLSVLPACGTIGVALNRTVIASFNEAMDSSTLTTATFIVTGPGGTPVAGSVVYMSGSHSATFTPANNLIANTVYSYVIKSGASGVKDRSGNPLKEDFGCSFTTGAASDVTPPTVISTNPANNATGVPLSKVTTNGAASGWGAALSKASALTVGKLITATFSEAMDPLTLNATTITITGPGGTPVAGFVTYAGTSVAATFIASTDLAPNTTYTGTITTGAKDLAGNALASNYVWVFTTGASSDATAPTVISTLPVNVATGIVLNTQVLATFSEAMDPSTITATTFTLKQGTTTISGSIAYAGTIAVFTPTVSLAANTVYTATVTTGAKDLAGNALASNYVWVFTTGASSDATPPTVLSTDPVNNATGVAFNKTVSATFSEAMNQSTITATTFTLKQGATTIPGSIAYAGTIAIFTPTVSLAANTVYTATVTTGAKDLAGNALASNYVWVFTTGAPSDATPPTVLSTDPVNNATGVALNKTVSATFSEAMNQSTITATGTYTVKQGATVVAGNVTYAGTTATFTPASNFAANTVYTATITTSAKDVAGNALLNNYSWNFTTVTVAPPTGQLLVNLGSAARFAILSNSAITNIPTSAITGDVGISPGARSSITGLTLPEVTGTIFAADDASPTPAMLIAAKADAMAAYLDATAAVRGTPSPVSGNINGLTLVPGLYSSGTSIEISPGGKLYLDAQGNANAVFVIRSATSITTSATSEVVLTNGANAANIFWSAGSAVTLGTNSKMKGTIIASTSISLLTGARLDGRALIQGAAAGQVSLDQSIIVKP